MYVRHLMKPAERCAGRGARGERPADVINALRRYFWNFYNTNGGWTASGRIVPVLHTCHFPLAIKQQQQHQQRKRDITSRRRKEMFAKIVRMRVALNYGKTPSHDL